MKDERVYLQHIRDALDDIATYCGSDREAFLQRPHAARCHVGVTAMPTAPITGEGPILGTVAYMSPEEAEGKPIDARSDLFSLGIILYEVATGQRPFTGETSKSIVSSILKDTAAVCH